ncbi:hypothetical protein [Marinomonas mediterranea]|jgi:hypothetical protein|uniref:Uncharacterized protein n=1 Tax=Marinomonas mediterranea (strain ATCC 700492 / JCM 21426 / NBRC 103028 / MMB-1) TaxID=717774 RepID=F2JTB8_MARM1|nr:hypothetical protein [Marinomonas mediterranea]ADZ90336.1 hypothetical protein Marme_1061 [Marinomonas mediterranea MMB-1]WCN16521.1 hypothetical protein GV053_05375 [Marinomonas mediterranea MMB-1]
MLSFHDNPTVEKWAHDQLAGDVYALTLVGGSRLHCDTAESTTILELHITDTIHSEALIRTVLRKRFDNAQSFARVSAQRANSGSWKLVCVEGEDAHPEVVIGLYDTLKKLVLD